MTDLNAIHAQSIEQSYLIYNGDPEGYLAKCEEELGELKEAFEKWKAARGGPDHFLQTALMGEIADVQNTLWAFVDRVGVHIGEAVLYKNLQIRHRKYGPPDPETGKRQHIPEGFVPDIDERKLHSTVDATVWAAEFQKLVDAGTIIDESLMISWFANAMQTAAMEMEGK